MTTDKELRSVLENLKKQVSAIEQRVSAIERILKEKPRIHHNKKTIEDLLIELKSEGFFRERRTISQIQDALHAKGRIVKLTDLPYYLLKLVRNNELKRERRLINKKTVWVYFV